jgi:hypothetical protein
MKPLLLTALAVLSASCNLDKLSGGRPPPAPAAFRLKFISQPGNTAAGAKIAPSIQVAAVDQGGSTATKFTGIIALTLATSPAGGTLSGTTRVTPVGGVATFSDLSITEAASGYTLTAVAESASAASSMAFDITPGPATRLAFTAQPSSTAANNSITPPVQVTAFDDYGNAATSFSGVLMVALGHDASVLQNARLSGSTTASAHAGVATFTNLSIDQTGNGYTLTATFGTGSPPVTSASFNITLF